MSRSGCLEEQYLSFGKHYIRHIQYEWMCFLWKINHDVVVTRYYPINLTVGGVRELED